MQATLDAIVVKLTEGESFQSALADSGDLAVEAVLASLGRVLCFSDFGLAG